MRSHLAAAWPCNRGEDEALGDGKVGDKAEVILVESSSLGGSLGAGLDVVFFCWEIATSFVLWVGKLRQGGAAQERDALEMHVALPPPTLAWGVFRGDEDSPSGWLGWEAESWGWLSLCQLLATGNGHRQPSHSGPFHGREHKHPTPPQPAVPASSPALSGDGVWPCAAGTRCPWKHGAGNIPGRGCNPCCRIGMGLLFSPAQFPAHQHGQDRLASAPGKAPGGGDRLDFAEGAVGKTGIQRRMASAVPSP